MSRYVYLILYCECSDGGSMGKTVRAFSHAAERDYVFYSESGDSPDLRGLEKADVEVDGAEWEYKYGDERES